MGERVCVCACVCMCVLRLPRCVRVSVGRQFQGSLILCLLTPDVRYVHPDAYRHRISQDPGF